MRRPRMVGARLVLFGIAFVGIVGLVIAGLWNALMPAIVGLPVITFWQALGLLVLSRLLLGGLGGWGHRMRRARFVKGWADLTPEERQRFRQAMGPGCRRGLGEDEPAGGSEGAARQ